MMRQLKTERSQGRGLNLPKEFAGGQLLQVKDLMKNNGKKEC